MSTKNNASLGLGSDDAKKEEGTKTPETLAAEQEAKEAEVAALKAKAEQEAKEAEVAALKAKAEQEAKEAEETALKAKEVEAALKLADAEVLQADICKLSDFTVEIDGKKVKAEIKGNSGINISGVHYSVEQFLADEALQIKAVQMNHIMLKLN